MRLSKMKRAYLMLLCLLAMWSSIRARQIEFEDCGSEAEVKSVEVDPCDNAKVCTLYAGSIVRANVTFVPANDVHSLTLRAYAILGKASLALPMTDNDACKKSGLKCPLKSGSLAVYQKRLAIPSSVPEMSAGLRTELRDQKQRKVLCIKTNIRLASE